MWRTPKTTPEVNAQEKDSSWNVQATDNQSTQANENPDKEKISTYGKPTPEANTQEKGVSVIPKVDIAWKKEKSGILKKGEKYQISADDYERIKHLVKKA